MSRSCQAVMRHSAEMMCLVSIPSSIPFGTILVGRVDSSQRQEALTRPSPRTGRDLHLHRSWFAGPATSTASAREAFRLLSTRSYFHGGMSHKRSSCVNADFIRPVAVWDAPRR